MSNKARCLLKVAATPLIFSSLMPAVIGRFRLQYPEVTIRVIDTDLKQVQALVESGAVNFGLGFFLGRQQEFRLPAAVCLPADAGQCAKCRAGRGPAADLGSIAGRGTDRLAAS